LDKIIALQPKMNGDCLKHAQTRGLEGGIERLEGRFEAFHFLRPYVGRHVLCQFVPLGQRTPDMPEFLQVMDTGILGFFGTERGVATRTA
jgi:hypothetical protein